MLQRTDARCGLTFSVPYSHMEPLLSALLAKVLASTNAETCVVDPNYGGMMTFSSALPTRVINAP